MKAFSPEMDKKCVDTIKILSMDAIQKANSGHPGAPMGCADMAYVIWSRFLRFNPDVPDWFNRDRFVLSNGHASMLLYSLLHLFEYKVTLEDIKNFRQMGSITPGHPEYGMTPGVEATTGPLGQGISMAVGMALSEKMARARFNSENAPFKPVDHYIYTICGDGCLMEGVSSEAASFAGLGNIIAFYDDNSITIEGSTSVAFTENVPDIFTAKGWQVIKIDGHDHEQIANAVIEAQNDPSRPCLICARTKIAKGAPTKEGSHNTHGSPLGPQEISAFKKSISRPDEPFFIPEDVKNYYKELVNEKREYYNKWQSEYEAFKKQNPETAQLIDIHLNKILPDKIEKIALSAVENAGKKATRALSGMVINKISQSVPWLIGGSADLAPSNNTQITNSPYIGDLDSSNKDASRFKGKNIHFGVREHGMGAIMNGICLHGFFKPFGGTFLVFSDYCRPAIRLSALMKTDPVYIFTHDSIFLGEDGPTHQAVEHLTALRAIPGLTVFRPADGVETAMAWAWALKNKKPAVLALSRQGLEDLQFKGDPLSLYKGAYIVKDFSLKRPEYKVTIAATGSETDLCIKAGQILNDKNIDTRVISVTSLELALETAKKEKDFILNSMHDDSDLIVSCEAGHSMSWYCLTGLKGLIISIDSFGESAPDHELARHFGFTPRDVAEKIKKAL
jgi:transketolase